MQWYRQRILEDYSGVKKAKRILEDYHIVKKEKDMSSQKIARENLFKGIVS
jgi:hypothetical protein